MEVLILLVNLLFHEMVEIMGILLEFMSAVVVLAVMEVLKLGKMAEADSFVKEFLEQLPLLMQWMVFILVYLQ